jgi:hypothetical protein
MDDSSSSDPAAGDGALKRYFPSQLPFELGASAVGIFCIRRAPQKDVQCNTDTDCGGREKVSKDIYTIERAAMSNTI